MTDQDRWDHIIAALARIEEQGKNACSDLAGIKLTLYGAEGRTGLVQAQRDAEHNQGVWNRLLGIVSAALTVLVAWLSIKGFKP